MIHGIYGLYSNDKDNEVAKMLAVLSNLGLENTEFHYFRFVWLETYFTKLRYYIANNLRQQLKDGDSLIAHSFGCAIIWELLCQLKKDNDPLKIHNIYLFNAALNRECVIPTDNIDKGYVFYDKEDRVLNIANFLPLNIMGDMGNTGYLHHTNTIDNIEITGVQEGIMHHSTAFLPQNINRYAEMIKHFEELK